MPPQAVFDSTLIRRRLLRAAGGRPADFLLARTIADLSERLAVVQRSFRDIVDLLTPGPHALDALRARCAEARLLRVAPVATPRAAPFDLVGTFEALPLAPERFDLAVSALALHQVDDLPGALIQIRRALKPDGLFLGALLGGRTLTELRDVMTAAEIETSGGASPRVAPFADVRDLGSLLQRAGFALPVVDSDVVTVRYDHAFALMADLRAMGATNALVARDRRPARRAMFARAAALYAARHADADGRIRATFEILSVSGWAPHASQQAPARPGSATVRLADVLRDQSGNLEGS